jgi:hypothetical protein
MADNDALSRDRRAACQLSLEWDRLCPKSAAGVTSFSLTPFVTLELAVGTAIRRGYARVEAAVSAEDLPCFSMAEAEWVECPSRIGAVTQAGWQAKVLSEALPLVGHQLLADLQAAVCRFGRQLGTATDHFAFDELSYQRYHSGSGHIAAHRDHESFRLLICILTLRGSAPFTVFSDDPSRTVIDAWLTAPGDLVLLRASGWPNVQWPPCPLHAVGEPITSERVVVTFRSLSCRGELLSPTRGSP